MDEIHDTTRRLRDYLAQKLPDRRNLRISAMQKLPVGFSYETALFTLEWDEAGGVQSEELVLRMEPEHGLIPPYDVRPQYEIMKRLHGSAVLVPRVDWLECDPAVLGRPFFIMERIHGEVMFSYSLAHPEQLPELRRQLVDAIVDVHALDWEALGLSVLGVPAHERAHAEREIERWEREYRNNVFTPYPLMNEFFRYLKNNVPRATRTCFCHCDVQPANLLVRDGKLVAVLDWELATVGDPVSDIGWSSATIEKFFGPAWNEGNYIRRHYEERSGTQLDEDSLRFWKVMSLVKGITMVFTGLRAGIELSEPKANLLGLFPINMKTFPDAAAKLIGF